MQTHKHILAIDCCNSFFFLSFEPLSSVNASLSTFVLFLLSLLFSFFFSESSFFFLLAVDVRERCFRKSNGERHLKECVCALWHTSYCSFSFLSLLPIRADLYFWYLVFRRTKSVLWKDMWNTVENYVFFGIDACLFFFRSSKIKRALRFPASSFFFLSLSCLLPFAFCLLPLRCLTSWQWR